MEAPANASILRGNPIPTPALIATAAMGKISARSAA
jgi:hypothetical protein